MMGGEIDMHLADNEGSIPFKQAAARRAVTYLRPGMIVGLGHGSTAAFAVEYAASLFREGLLPEILCIPCSAQVEKEALALGLPLTTLEEHPVIDITIDGADEADPELNLIKGAGGALLKEKIVAQASRREIIVADDTKLSPCLGARSALPVEVVAFGISTHVAFLENLGATAMIRMDHDRIFQTDHGHVIIDCRFKQMENPERLSRELKEHAGVVEHGLFLGIATDMILAGPAGIRHLTAKQGVRRPDGQR